MPDLSVPWTGFWKPRTCHIAIFATADPSQCKRQVSDARLMTMTISEMHCYT